MMFVRTDAEVDDLALAGDALPYMISNSASRNGGATLFLTTLTRVWLPTTSSPFLIAPMRRMSRRTEEVELERVAAGGGLGVAEHHADLHADLVDEDDDGVRALDVAGELAQRLRHQARLQADCVLAHLALDLGLGRERGDRVDDDDVDRAGAHQHVGDLECLLAGVRLRDQQVVDVDAELLGIGRIERVLGVDEGGGAAALLALGDDLQRQRGLAGGLGPVDLDDAAARQAADAERDVEPQRAGRLSRPRRRRSATGVAEAHDRALAELLLDLPERGGQRLLAVVIHGVPGDEPRGQGFDQRSEFGIAGYAHVLATPLRAASTCRYRAR
jgi:hypothetical protein